MHVLLVEDDKRLRGFIAKALRAEGYAVSVSENGDDALIAVLNGGVDIVVLDIMIPGRDGLSVVTRLRAAGDNTPILLCSARSDPSERVQGLDAGADDYVAKPFLLEELLARVRALLRRSAARHCSVLRVADLTLDRTDRSVQRAGREITLTPREFRLLECLMVASPRVCTRTTLLEKVWDFHFDPGSNIVDVYVGKLREKIDSDSETKLLRSVRGVGYILKENP